MLSLIIRKQLLIFSKKQNVWLGNNVLVLVVKRLVPKVFVVYIVGVPLLVGVGFDHLR